MSNRTGNSSVDGAPENPTGRIQLRDIQKEFGDTVAVDGIDLEIASGEFLVLLGPSGCGKTTTLRMVAGLETPTDGTITLDGREITTQSPQKRDISIVFQNYALYPHLTVRENFEFPLGKTDLSSDQKDEKIRRTANMLDIEDLLEKDPDQLSGGQQQRVALGRTIIRDPQVFLMDEPLASLDAKLRVQTRTEIRELQQELGVTTLYVTHDQEEAMSIADRIAIMNDGEIEQIGSPKEVYEKPNNVFVAEFLGEPSINILERTGTGSGSRPPIVSDLDIPCSDTVERVGIRPEDIHLWSAREDVPAAEWSDPVSVSVSLVEPLGDGYELTLEHGGEELRMTSRARPAGGGNSSNVRIAVDVEEVYRFDSNGNRVGN